MGFGEDIGTPRQISTFRPDERGQRGLPSPVLFPHVDSRQHILHPTGDTLRRAVRITFTAPGASSRCPKGGTVKSLHTIRSVAVCLPISATLATGLLFMSSASA